MVKDIVQENKYENFKTINKISNHLLVYSCVFSYLALVFFYIYFLSKSYSVHDLQEELKDESADMLESLYDKSSRNNILYNADWNKIL